MSRVSMGVEVDRIAGVDEVGRGPLAGPVVTAAVILDPRRPIVGLADSKALSAARRVALAAEIRRRARAWALGRAEVEEIDRLVRDGLGLRWSVVGPFETVDLNWRGGIGQHSVFRSRPKAESFCGA